MISINTFETLFWIYFIFIVFYLSLFVASLIRFKKIYPEIWKRFGSPTFFPTWKWRDSVLGVNILFSTWPDEINDKLLIIMRNILKITRVLGVIFFLILITFFVLNKY